MDMKPLGGATIAGDAQVDHAIATLVLTFLTDPLAQGCRLATLTYAALASVSVNLRVERVSNRDAIPNPRFRLTIGSGTFIVRLAADKLSTSAASKSIATALSRSTQTFHKPRESFVKLPRYRDTAKSPNLGLQTIEIGYAQMKRIGERSMDDFERRPSVVLVHGAWADGSSWSDIIGPLLSRGLNVLAAPVPLTSLWDDIAALERALERTNGPVVLAAHAYAGAVIAASTNERVQSLVFIAALAPDEGETVAEVFYRDKPHPQAPKLAPDAHGFIWMPQEGFTTAFAQHASPERARLFAATQRPIAVACIQEKAPRPTWKVKPSWYLIAQEDRMINPATQLFMAQRMGACIRSEKVDHTPLATAPELVIGVILEAVANSVA
jgi:pimeloyl-ACP methyl ester carboxylesterase